MTEKTFLFELRDAARQMENLDYRLMMKEVADQLASAIDSFHNHSTNETLAEVQGLWAKATRIYNRRPDNAPPPAPLAPAIELRAVA